MIQYDYIKAKEISRDMEWISEYFDICRELWYVHINLPTSVGTAGTYESRCLRAYEGYLERSVYPRRVLR